MQEVEAAIAKEEELAQGQKRVTYTPAAQPSPDTVGAKSAPKKKTRVESPLRPKQLFQDPGQDAQPPWDSESAPCRFLSLPSKTTVETSEPSPYMETVDDDYVESDDVLADELAKATCLHIPPASKCFVSNNLFSACPCMV